MEAFLEGSLGLLAWRRGITWRLRCLGEAQAAWSPQVDLSGNLSPIGGNHPHPVKTSVCVVKKHCMCNQNEVYEDETCDKSEKTCRNSFEDHDGAAVEAQEGNPSELQAQL